VIDAQSLRPSDLVRVEAGELIPLDGEILRGAASVNEAAITGESAPVIREAGGDRSAVTGGTTVLSDHLIIRITAAPGETFIDRMIALVEGAARQKTPNELALSVLLSGMTLIFLIATVSLWGLAGYSGTRLSVVVLVALLVTLIPTRIGGLLSAIGIAGMDRVIRFNVVATSGRAVEAAGDVDTLLLDKTGTITFGKRLLAHLGGYGGGIGGGEPSGEPRRRDARGPLDPRLGPRGRRGRGAGVRGSLRGLLRPDPGFGPRHRRARDPQRGGGCHPGPSGHRRPARVPPSARPGRPFGRQATGGL
jgi:hypothetical protein